MDGYHQYTKNPQAIDLGINLFKATPHKDRLSPLWHICLHIFRHITQILLAGRQPTVVGFRQSHELRSCYEKSVAQSVALCGNLNDNLCAVLP